MPGERLTLWTSAAAAGSTLVAVAFSAAVIWNVASKQRAQFVTELAALNTKVEATNAKIDKAGETVAEIKKITALENTTKQIALLNSEIMKTNEGLAELRQSSSLDGIKATLATLDSKIEKTGAALAELKKSAPIDLIKTELDGIKATLSQVDSKIEKTGVAMAELKKSAPIDLIKTELDGIKATLSQVDSKIEKTGVAMDELKKPAPIDAMKAEFEGIKVDLASLATRIDAKIEASNKALADIKAASLQAAGTQSAGDAARDKAIANLDTVIDDIKAGIAGLKTDLADTASSRAKSLDAITKSIDTLKAPAMALKTGKALEGLHVPDPSAVETTSSIPVIQPLTVRFDRIGRAILNAQTNTIIGNLKTIMKDRRNCSISVAGYSDTFGRDDANLDVSQERADIIAAKLKTAFTGQAIRIDSVGWGERRLKVWTPDGRIEMANRRVDVSVDCKG